MPIYFDDYFDAHFRAQYRLEDAAIACRHDELLFCRRHNTPQQLGAASMHASMVAAGIGISPDKVRATIGLVLLPARTAYFATRLPRKYNVEL